LQHWCASVITFPAKPASHADKLQFVVVLLQFGCGCDDVVSVHCVIPFR
jgi:hypothetical protein